MFLKKIFPILLSFLIFACSRSEPTPTPGPSPGPPPVPTCKGSVCIANVYIKLHSNSDLTIEFDLGPRTQKVDAFGNPEPAEDVNFKDVTQLTLYDADNQNVIWSGEIAPGAENYSCYEPEEMAFDQQRLVSRCGLELQGSVVGNSFEIGEYIRVEILEFKYDRNIEVQSN